MTVKLHRDFKEFLRLLTENEVEYMVVGGYAVGSYGYVRATIDLDIWIRPEKSNAEKVITVLNQFGFTQAFSAESFLDPKKLFRMGVPPVRLELLTSLSGLEFESAFANSVMREIDGMSLRLIGLGDLKTNKRETGRQKDLADLENLP